MEELAAKGGRAARGAATHAEDGGPRADVARTVFDRLLKVVGHAHRQPQRARLHPEGFRSGVAATDQHLEVVGGVVPVLADAHETRQRQPVALAVDELAQPGRLLGADPAFALLS